MSQGVQSEDITEGNSTMPPNDSELRTILDALWFDKWLIATIAFSSMLAAFAYAFNATELYRAEVQLAPVASKGTEGLLNQLGGLGGLASLAGLAVSNGNNSDLLAVLKSRDFARDFIAEQNLLPVLFHRDWDTTARKWKFTDPKKVPDLRDGVKRFTEDIMSVVEDKRTGLVLLTVEWENPRLASEWANLLVERVNDATRQRAVVDAQTNVSYLQQQLAAASVVTLQQSIGRLLDGELQKLMVARGRKEFAFRVIDRAEVPKWRSSPKRARLVATAGIVGLTLGMLLACVRQVLLRRRSV